MDSKHKDHAMQQESTDQVNVPAHLSDMPNNQMSIDLSLVGDSISIAGILSREVSCRRT
jgi:hypothetical protein